MPAIHFLSEFDKIKAYQNYRPIITDLSKFQLETLVLMLLNGSDLEYAINFCKEMND